MTPFVWLLLSLNLVVDSAGQLAFKAAAADPDAGEGAQRWRAMARRPYLWIGMACYVVEFLLWIAFLSLVPLSVGVLLGSINIVVVMLLGRALFKERLTLMRVAGAALVSAGVAVVGLGARG
ncbi:EamA family transporter [Roseateles sp. MS654]|jgi:drug/metabolite transporter (DMT)-like permease|uniref:EamA family transporter n=1 Tax=Roseateles sp. MS654 TaxID=3412685 RepID=UPI003C2D756A